MANLFWKKQSATTGLLATPFKTEEEFEKLVFDTGELLEDIFLLKRQIRGGAKTGIPDIIGIDTDGNICIIEMKNVAVDASTIPQVLQYAFWAETNPDSIKSLWLEAEDKPEDITVGWEDFEVRIIVIAPEIQRSTLQLVEKIKYPTDLIEVKRWVEGPNTFLLVNRLEPESARKSRPVSGLEKYDAKFYETNYNRNSAKKFMQYVKDLERIVKDKGWNLQTKYNKQYCSFKAGFFNAFGIKWVGTKTFALFFRLSEEELAATGVKLTRYDDLWHEGIANIEPGKTRLESFAKAFKMAHHKLTGD